MRLAAIDSTNSGFDVEFGYDGQEMVLESLSGGRTRRYVHGPGVDEPLVAYLVTPGVGTSRAWYQADERGSIVRHSLDSGAPGAIGKYDEYGAGGTGRFRYTGQYWLGEANLMYYRARIYDARLGRFLQPDPIGYGGGMNMYAYVGGDPVNFTDPLGLQKENEDEDEEDIFVDYWPPAGGGGGGGGGWGGGSWGGGGWDALLPLDEPLPGNLAQCTNADCSEAVVTRHSGKTPWVIVGGRYVRDRHYTQPWYAPYMEYAFIFGPPTMAASAIALPEGLAIAQGAGAATRGAAMSPTSKLFARGTGRLNSNNVLRVGQGWKGSAQQGKSVFRVSIGHRSWPAIPGLPPFPWHIP